MQYSKTFQLAAAAAAGKRPAIPLAYAAECAALFAELYGGYLYNSIFSGRSQNPKLATVQYICDGLGIKLKDFFDSPLFDEIDVED